MRNQEVEDEEVVVIEVVVAGILRGRNDSWGTRSRRPGDRGSAPGAAAVAYDFCRIGTMLEEEEEDEEEEEKELESASAFGTGLEEEEMESACVSVADEKSAIERLLGRGNVPEERAMMVSVSEGASEIETWAAGKGNETSILGLLLLGLLLSRIHYFLRPSTCSSSYYPTYPGRVE